MKWNLTEDQKALVNLIAKYRAYMISNEEFAVNITEAGFERKKPKTTLDVIAEGFKP